MTLFDRPAHAIKIKVNQFYGLSKIIFAQATFMNRQGGVDRGQIGHPIN